MREPVSTQSAASPTGPYSQGIKARGTLVFTAGQGPLDPVSGQVLGSSIEEQTARTLDNVQAILEAAGASLADVVKVHVYLQSMDDFSRMGQVYERYFSPPYPARTTVAAGLLGILVEIDVIAVIPQ